MVTKSNTYRNILASKANRLRKTFKKHLKKLANKFKESLPLQSHLREDVVLSYGYANVAQLVEHDLAKVGVAGSSLVIRSNAFFREGIFLVT